MVLGSWGEERGSPIFCGGETGFDLGGVVFGELEADETAGEFFGDDEGGSAAAEGIEDSFAGVGAGVD